MKGFIEIKISDTRNALINVNQIESVVHYEDKTKTIIFFKNCFGKLTIEESYEDIVNKIKEATED